MDQSTLVYNSYFSGTYDLRNILHIFFTNSQGQHLDVICFNRYNGWYKHTGALYDIAQKVEDEATQFHGHNKPVIMTEYGADTIAGLHLVSPNL